ncbi:MAG: TolB family protein, partial [Myxococcales bacterium]
MAHQFTIQKVRDAALAAGTENPLMAFPLWFIEGLAEYMVYLGMDPEGDMMVRDLLLNPVPEQGYALPDFFNATAGGYIGVYKLGQARLTFLAQVYGHQKVLELMERSPEMVGAPPPGVDAPPAPRGPPPAMPGQPQAPPDAEPTPEDQGLPPSAVADADKVPQGPPASFEDYMARVLGESPTRIRERYQAWLKRRYFDSFLDARQNVADFALYMGLKGEPDSFSVSPDGNLILYRTVERMTGLSSLYLQDLRAPDSRVIIATDQRPGLESLHPVDRRVTSLGTDRLVFTARSGETDVLYVVPFKTETGTEGGVVTAKITLGERQRFDLGEILEVFDPVLAPDGQRVVFAGVDLEGFRDLYALNVEGPNRGRIERLTHDVWAESDLSWDGNRILFVSDATESHEPNVFALDLQTRATERLTHHGEEDRQPVAALGGVVFRSYRGGKP